MTKYSYILYQHLKKQTIKQKKKQKKYKKITKSKKQNVQRHYTIIAACEWEIDTAGAGGGGVLTSTEK